MERTIKIRFFKGGFYGTWIREKEDFGYIVRVWDGEVLLTEERFEGKDITEKEEFLYSPKEVIQGKEYQFCLEVIAETIFASGMVPKGLERLSHLKQNILTHTTTEGSYVLNLEVMEDEALAELFKKYLGCTELTIQKPNQPELLEEEQLLLIQGENVQVWFWMDDNLILQMNLFFLEKELELFKDTDLEELFTIENQKLCLVSCSHIWQENINLEYGWNFLGELTLPLELNAIDDNTVERQSICFVGRLEQLENGIRFYAKNIGILKSFYILGRDKNRYILEVPTFFIKIEGCIAHVWLECVININGQNNEMRVSLLDNEFVDISYLNPQLMFPTMECALSYIEGKDRKFVLPIDFRSILDVEVKNVGIVWTSPQHNQDMYYLQISGKETSVVLLPGKLELIHWNLICRRIEYLFEDKTSVNYIAKLEGEFLIANEKKVQLSATFSKDTDWEVYLKNEQGNWFLALTNLLGIQEKEFSKRLSFLWKGAEIVTLDMVRLRYLPTKQKLADVSFYMYMDEPLEIIPSALSLERIGIAVHLTQEEQWNYDIHIDGAIKIGSGDRATEIFVIIPIQQEMTSITISTSEQGLLLPSFDDILKTVGIADGQKWIPSVFWNLDDIRISKFNITVGIVSQNVVQSFLFGVTTEKTYVISIGKQEFLVKKLELFLDFDAEKGLRFTGNGQFSFFGLEADVQITAQVENKISLQVELSNEQIKELSFEQVADSFVDTESGKYENLPIPESFKKPKFEKAIVYIEEENKLCLMYGKVSGLGNALFVSVQQQTESGYVFVAVLDESFSFAGICSGLAVLDSCFKIQRAGILLSSLSIYNLLDITENLPIDAKEIFDSFSECNTQLHAGVFLCGTMAFTAPIFSNLVKLGKEKDELILESYAYLPKEEKMTEVFARVNEFLLFGIFKFQDISICYRIRDKQEFDLNGTLIIEIDNQELAFTGAMQVKEAESHFSVKSIQSVKEPLGISGFELNNIMLQLDVVFQKEEYEENTYTMSIGGEITLGTVVLNAWLLLQAGVVKVYRMSLEQPLNVDDLFAGIFTSKVWPAGCLKIMVDEGVLYKANEECIIGEEIYQKGFYLKSRLILYGFSFEVEGKFGEDSFEIIGTTHNTISLGILNITGAKGALGAGIKFSGNEREKILGITGGIELFGERLADVNMLGYDTKQKLFKGSIEYSGNVELFKGAKISFTWEEGKGVHIEEFPMQFIDETLDFAKMLEKASKSAKSECGELVGLAFDKVVKTKFEIEPSFGELMEDGITIELQPKYQVFVTSEKILEASMKKLFVKVSKPEKIGFDVLAKLIIDTVLENAINIAEQIINDSDSFVKFITLIGAVEGTRKTFSTLICHGAKELLKGTIENTKVQDFAIQASKSVAEGSLGSAAGAAAGAGMAYTEAEIWLDGAILFFGGLFTTFVIINEKDNSKEHAKEYKEKTEQIKKEAEEAERNAREAVRSMLVIKELKVEEQKGGRLIVSWNEIETEGLDVTYHIVAEENGIKVLECMQKEVRKEIILQEGRETELKISVYAIFVYQEKRGDYTYIGETAQITYTAGKPLTLLMDRLPEAKAGEMYQFTLQAQGGIRPYRYKVHGLPEGLSLQDDTINGILRFGGGEVLVDITVIDALERTTTKSCWMLLR